MKEQTPETTEHVIQDSIGQRPIHATYEPPGPLPQFRPRPKLSIPQPTPKRRPPVPATVKLINKPSPETATAKPAAPQPKTSPPKKDLT